MAAQGWSKQSQFGGHCRVGGHQHELFLPEVRHPALTGQFRGQKNLDQPADGAQIARFRDKGLQITLGRKNPAEFG